MEEVRPGLYRIEIPLPGNPLKYLNSYVLTSKDRNLIIDTGLNQEECQEAMEAGLQAIGVDLGRTDIFITHLHADHFGLVSKLARPDSTTVYFNRPDKELIESTFGWEPMINYAGQSGFPEDLLRDALMNHPGYKYSPEWIPELNVLVEGDIIEVGDYRLRCIETPGHTLGHICLYDDAKKILIAGDHILIDITPNIQCWSDRENSLQNYLNSLDKIIDLDVELVLPGHRRLFPYFRERVEELKRHHNRRADEVLSILTGGSQNAFQIASQMSWDIKYAHWDLFPVAQKWFATGEAIAHLRYLEEKRLIAREENGGTGIVFSLLRH
jgi:glyoxylase-like metal-dependent hydrolase (beta-lactamase superfamily II)